MTAYSPFGSPDSARSVFVQDATPILPDIMMFRRNCRQRPSPCGSAEITVILIVLSIFLVA